jgi:periplasmic copper chaperone A
MATTNGRRRVLQQGLALATVGMLPVAGMACEVEGEFLRITHPWTRATAPGAQTGVLCMRIDNVTADDRLIGIDTPAAGGAVLIEGGEARPLNLPIPAGSDIEMHEQGLHLRLVPLNTALHAGRTYPLQLHFERSGVVMATLSVDFARFS